MKEYDVDVLKESIEETRNSFQLMKNTVYYQQGEMEKLKSLVTQLSRTVEQLERESFIVNRRLAQLEYNSHD